MENAFQVFLQGNAEGTWSCTVTSPSISATWTVVEFDSENIPELFKEISLDEGGYNTIEPWEAIAVDR